jgi:YidC/Oxa1 family membrane protein insertase
MWNTVFIEPLYNTLIFLTNGLWGYLALGIIALTFIIRLVLSPLSVKAIKTQLIQQKLRPEMDKIRKEITDQAEQAKAIMELYKKHNTSMFAGCLPVLIQIPIILALYQALVLAGKSQTTGLLYQGITLSESFSPWLFSINLYEYSILLALLAGITQYIQLSLAPVTVSDSDPNAQMMKVMKYILPIMITVFAARVPAAVALYWVMSNVATIAIEYVIRKKFLSN